MSRRLGYAAVAFSAVLFALGGVFARSLMDQGANPVELTEGRAWVATAGLGLILLIRRGVRRPSRASETPKERFPLVPTLMFGGFLAAANLTYYLSISYLPVAIAVVLQYTGPAVVVLWKAVVDRTPPTRRVLVALFLSLCGVVLVTELHKVLTGGGVGLSAIGMLFAGIASLAYAGYVLLGEHVGKTVDFISSTFYAFVTASTIWLVVQLFRGEPTTLDQPRFWPPIVFLAVASTIASFLLFMWGLKRIGASRAGITSTLEPVSAALFAWLFLSQGLSVVQIVGAALVIMGIGAIQAEKKAPDLEAA
ncbi:MAG TPA: EamA family transporter [Actinomycetota bacterium]|nr:EamA family transporter [Actinomycetota bacterium]